MILTGRAKEDFEKWAYKDISRLMMPLPSMYYPQNDIYLHAFVIEWFDSVGIYLTIGIYGYILNTDGIKVTKKTGDTRQQSTKEAIKKANQIYNEKFSR